MADRMTVNQTPQIGTETTPGTTPGSGANRLLACYDWMPAPEADVLKFRPSGHKHTTVVEENMEWSSMNVTGPMDFNGILYAASSALSKSATPALISPSTMVYKWLFTPPIKGTSNPQTYYWQQGDGTFNHAMNYMLLHDFSYKLTRKNWTYTGKGFGQKLAYTGVTLTATPTAIALSPAVPNTVSVFLDATSAGIGTTQLTKFFELDFGFNGAFGTFWTIDATKGSFAGHADLAPKAGGKLLLEADTAGMAFLGYLQTGVTYYLQVKSTGPVIDSGNSLNATIIHNMAIKVSKPNPFKDEEGIYAIEWDYELVEDPAWGTSGTATTLEVHNLLATL